MCKFWGAALGLVSHFSSVEIRGLERLNDALKAVSLVTGDRGC